MNCGRSISLGEKRKTDARPQFRYTLTLDEERGVTVHDRTAASESRASAVSHDQPVRGASRRVIADRVPARHVNVVRRGGGRITKSRGGGYMKRPSATSAKSGEAVAGQIRAADQRADGEDDGHR